MKDDEGQARLEHEDTQKTNQATQNNLRQPTSSRGEITTEDNTTKSPKNEKEIKYKRPLTRFEGMSICFGIVGILVGAITGGAIVWQDIIAHASLVEIQKQFPELKQSSEAAKSAADTASGALKASVTEFRQQVRPYIVVDTTRMNRVPTEGVILGIESVIRNTGTTPALNLQASYTFHFQKTLPCHYAPGAIRQEDPAINVGAGLTRAVRAFGERGLLRPEVEAIQGKTMFVCYSAVFEYDDIFEERHRTEVCSYYQPPKPVAAVGEGDLFLYACKDHNGIK